MILTRDIAMKALLSAFDARMEAEFRNLADPYSASASEKRAAQETFETGFRRTCDAFEFAARVIVEIFPEVS